MTQLRLVRATNKNIKIKKKKTVKEMSSSKSILSNRLSESSMMVSCNLLRYVCFHEVNSPRGPHVDLQDCLRRENQNISKCVVMTFLSQKNSPETDTTKKSCCLRPRPKKVSAWFRLPREVIFRTKLHVFLKLLLTFS